MFKKALLLVFGLIVALAVVLVTNTLRYAPDETQTASQIELPKLDVEKIAANISRAVTFKTVSHQKAADFDLPAFEAFNTWLKETYPLTHQTMTLTMSGVLTPIYKWEGADPSLKPVLLTGHYDVVPVQPGTEGDWTEPPYSGNQSDGFVWGRGTLDDKGAVLGMLEAAEHLIGQGKKPARTIYFIFGHDEEVGGWRGAGQAVHDLKQQGVQFEWSLDEGSMVLDGILPGITRPIASINIAEKGYVTLDLKARAKGGHSSLPPNETAVGILASAIDRLQNNPVPGGLTDVSAEFFDKVATHFPFVQRMLFANRWLFGVLLESELSKSAATNAMLRTTTAPTMLSASVKENVLPIEAVATVNFRIHPRDSVQGVVDYVSGIVDDERVAVEIRGKGNEPSPVSSSEAEGFAFLSTTFQQVFGDPIVVPGITVAATDTKHYSRISDNSYRINPLVFGSDDIPRIHGTNERISLENIEKMVQFYIVLMENLDGS